MVAKIVLNASARELHKVFDYNIPEELIGTVTVGHKVTVPFGLGNILAEGFVIDICEKSNLKKLKSISGIKDVDNVIGEKGFALAKFISERYFCNLGAALNLFSFDKVKCQKSKVFEFKHVDDFKANPEQKNAIDKLNIAIEEECYKKFLLFGVTGSGKTEVYLQVIKKLIKEGKGAIVLVPEISLTPQTVRRFVERLGSEVAVIHSRLSKGQKYEQWAKIKSGEAKVVVGARSALFAPVSNLGLVIIDEEHDSSYKSGQTPYYDAREVAEKLCELNNAVLLLGSATPSINTYYNVKNCFGEVLRLNNRNNNKMPDVCITDMRQELVNGNKMVFSSKLYSEIKQNLQNKEQTILFLNRRGYSTFVSCRKCGFVAKCRKCNMAYTYHSVEDELVCHYCGAKIKNFEICPICNEKYIKHFGIGTEKLEAAVKSVFPEARIIRMDLDTTSKKDSHEEILNKFRNGEADILVGTQMIAKGHDFPNVTLVGVVAADMSLNTGDYMATERTFDLITQVAGRAGRGEKQGRVVVQTYESENYSIIASKNQDYEEFYNQEIKIREQLNYPPFCDIILINVSNKDEARTIEASRFIYQTFHEALKGYDNVQVLPENPCPISRINNKYRWRVIIKANLNDEITNLINNLLISKKFGTIKDVDYTIERNPVMFS